MICYSKLSFLNIIFDKYSKYQCRYQCYSDDHDNQLEKVKTHFIVNKEVIKKHWNGIITIPNPFGALSFTFIAKDAGIYHKTFNFEKN